MLFRRTRSAVMKDLPPRTTEIVRIPPTAEQLDIELAQMRVVSSIVAKKYISEMDLLRLQKALLIARTNANSTYLVDKRVPGWSSKLERLEELLDELAAEEARKIVLFSEWTTRSSSSGSNDSLSITFGSMGQCRRRSGNSW